MPLVNGGAISTKAKFKNQKGLLACPAVQSLSPRAGSYDVLRVLLHQTTHSALRFPVV
jgi:hypothetical protein